MNQMGYNRPAGLHKMSLTKIFGSAETLLVTNTYQFDDYSKYETSGIDVTDKIRTREEVFPEDCKKAYEMGVRLTGTVNW